MKCAEIRVGTRVGSDVESSARIHAGSGVAKFAGTGARTRWLLSALLSVSGFATGCSDPVSLGELVYRCDPAGNDCAIGSVCVKAGTEYVCGQPEGCVETCATD